MSAHYFFRQLDLLPAEQRAALKATATNPTIPDVTAHDAFTSVYWNSNLRRDSSRIVAALYFWHPVGGKLRLPQALARQNGKGDRERNERLLAEILAAPLPGLPPLLFEAVRRLRAAQVAINWPQLLADLSKWDRPHKGDTDRIQDVWANCWLDAVSPTPTRS